MLSSNFFSIPNVLAIAIWLFGLYVWISNPYGDINIGAREVYIPAALTGSMLFVVKSDKADEVLNGLGIYSKIFGFLGLVIVTYVVKIYLSDKGI